MEKKTTKIKVNDITYISIAVAIMAVCSWITIPFTVPFTLQTFAVFFTILFLGGRKGFFAVLAYLLLGAIGMPVFSGFNGGMGILIGVTGGYILGFLGIALVMWLFEHIFGNKTIPLIISMVLGLIILYAFGTAQFVYLYTANTGAITVLAALSKCVFPFILPDILKISLAFIISKRIKALYHY